MTYDTNPPVDGENSTNSIEETPETPALMRLSEIGDALQAAMGNELREHERLLRQGALLDDLFTLLVGDKVRERLEREAYATDSMMDYLDFALRVQKQCVDTIKARAAIDYMQSLSTPRPAP